MNTLYLEKIGMNDNSIVGDIKNHRVRAIDNISISFQGVNYSLFMEFSQWAHYTYRTTNKRTGAALKKPVRELVNANGVFIDTQYDKEEENANGYKFTLSYRLSSLEKEIAAENYSFTRSDILTIVNSYSIEKYSRVALIEEEADRIINRIGGYREKSIIAADHYYTPEQWDNGHKVVKVSARSNNPDMIDRSIAVDLVTGKICG